jgi:hypothetical protein
VNFVRTKGPGGYNMGIVKENQRDKEMGGGALKLKIP